MLEQAFEALKTYKWGIDPKGIKPIQDAVVATHGNAAARKELESKLAAALDTDIPRAAKDSVCRFLKTIGTAHSVPALAKLLHDAELSHMARHALQTIDAKEAASALVNAIDKAPKKIQIGIISSLGARGKDVPVGALALGAIGSEEAVKALAAAKATDANKIAICDAMFQCAENMLNHGKKSEAKAIYSTVLKIGPTKAAKMAAELGIKASA